MSKPLNRSAVPVEHTWDLRSLFATDDEWEQALETFEQRIPEIDAFKGTLSSSIDRLREALDYIHEMALLGERIGYYAHLRMSEDLGDSSAQGRMSRAMALSTAFEARSSYVTPEIQAIPDTLINHWREKEELADYRIYLDRLLRYKPHVLSEPEERILALQSEFAQTPRNGFNALADVDMQFGEVETAEGPRTLTHASYAAFLQDPDRSIRRQAYTQYYAEFDAHKHTLAALYHGQVQYDVYRARVRRFPSAIEAALFGNDVPVTVYDRLVDSVRAALPSLHHYYGLRRRALELDTLRLYDVRVPLVPEIQTRHTYEAAVDLVTEAAAPLGDEYVEVLRRGLQGRWVDRYENKGKRSGAFSAGSYTSDPFILMNYKDDVLNDVFTLAHEAGHSMHSWYSAREQAFPHYHYSIFVAEVASTFNELLLARTLLKKAGDTPLRVYLVNKQVDDLLATLFRQTMFAEFERATHAMVERNEPLTVDSLTTAYRELLKDYFGPDVPLEEHSALEGLRVPHFYSAFYVYQYATGIAAAMALYERVIHGGAPERDRYLAFLKSGGSAFPLEQLRQAGVDMTSSEAVQTALLRFDSLVRQLDTLLTTG